MDASTVGMERLLKEKIGVYQTLIGLLEQEKKSLMASDVDALWRFAARKQECAVEIEGLRKRIMQALESLGIQHGMNTTNFRVERVFAFLPPEDNRRLSDLQQSFLSVKAKVHALSRANKNFVEEYLSVLDDMIGIITNAGKATAPYEKMRGPDGRERANLLLHREV